MMTRRGLEKYMSEAPAIAQEINESPDLVLKVLKRVEVHMENGRRHPKPPAPEGGISIRAGGRKYGVPFRSISRWVQRGLIPVLLATRNEKYIDEKKLAEVALLYQKNPGQGRATIKRHLSD